MHSPLHYSLPHAKFDKQLHRTNALNWWNNMNLEQQFYATIRANHLIKNNHTRHPNWKISWIIPTLTNKEIEIIYQEAKKQLLTFYLLKQ